MLKPFNFRALATLALVFAMVRTTGVAYGLASAGGDVVVKVLGDSIGKNGISTAEAVMAKYGVSKTVAEAAVAKVAVLAPLALANGLTVGSVDFASVAKNATSLNVDAAASKLQAFLSKSNGAVTTQAMASALGAVSGLPMQRQNLNTSNANVAAADFTCPVGATACSSTLSYLDTANISASQRAQLKLDFATTITAAQQNVGKLCHGDATCASNLLNGLSEVYAGVPGVFQTINSKFALQAATGTGQFAGFASNYNVISQGIAKIGADAKVGKSPGQQLEGCFVTGG